MHHYKTGVNGLIGIIYIISIDLLLFYLIKFGYGSHVIESSRQDNNYYYIAL